MYRIYTPHGPYLQSISGSDVRPRQNILGVHRELFLFEYAKMLLHCQLRDEGLLSPYAEPFFPVTESVTENNTDISGQDQNSQKEPKELNNPNLKDNCTKNNENQATESDWKEYKNITTKIKDTENKEGIHSENKYDVLQEPKEEEDMEVECEDVQDVQGIVDETTKVMINEKPTVKDMKDINDMSLEEVEKVLDEEKCREEDKYEEDSDDDTSWCSVKEHVRELEDRAIRLNQDKVRLKLQIETLEKQLQEVEVKYSEKVVEVEEILKNHKLAIDQKEDTILNKEKLLKQLEIDLKTLEERRKEMEDQYLLKEKKFKEELKQHRETQQENDKTHKEDIERLQEELLVSKRKYNECGREVYWLKHELRRAEEKNKRESNKKTSNPKRK